MDDKQLDSFIKRHCSGINLTINEKANPDNCEEGYAEIVASTKCLDRNILKVIDIFKMIFFKPRLFNPLAIMNMTKNFLNDLNDHDDSLIFILVGSNLTNPCAIANALRGPYQVHFLKELIEKNDWFDASVKLTKTYHEIFLNAKVECRIETETENSLFLDQIKEIIKSFKESENLIASPVDKSIFQEYKNIFISTDSLTNFTLITCKTVSYNDDSNPLYLVLSEIMTNEFLIEKIRLEIGAYDVLCLFNAQLGIFEIRSFRDPDPFKCLETYKKALEFFSCEENITDDMVDRAIINVFGYLTTKNESQHRRNIIYNATKQQIVEIAKILKEKEWNCVIISNSYNTKPPEGFTIVNIKENKKTKKMHYIFAIIIILIILIMLAIILH